MTRRVKIAAVSYRLAGQSTARQDRIDQAFAYVEAAALDGPDLVLLPELCETLSQEFQQVRQIKDHAARLQAVLEFAETEDGPILSRTAEAAARHRVIVVNNTLVRDGDRCHNQATFVGRDGEIVGRYRKVQPTEGEYEDMGITPGDDLRPIEVEGVRYGVMICNDQAFPEICQIYMLQGVDVLLHPTQAAGPTETIRSELLRTRAHDSSCYLAVSGFCGAEKLAWSDRESRATIYDYNGYAVADSGHREGHVMAELGLDEARWTSWCRDKDHRQTILRQARADLYGRYYLSLAEKKENMVDPEPD